MIGSSTSGFKPSRAAAAAGHAGQSSSRTRSTRSTCCRWSSSSASRDATCRCRRRQETLRGIGMYPLHVRKEIDAHIADRLLEAVWREALWLVKDGSRHDARRSTTRSAWASACAGRRWACSRPTASPAARPGCAHFLAQFGPALTWPWTKLMDVPELDDELVDLIADQSDAQSGALLDPRAGAASATTTSSAFCAR